ncbi:hypothetical protein RYX36_028457 [Vicia faba]
MGMIGETVDSIKSLQIRQVLTQAVSLGMIVTSALIIWKALMCITGSESPVVVVLSGRDNNYGDDRLLYAHGQLWLQRHHIMGRAVGFLPYVGWVTIIMTEKPIIKYILIGALGLLVITSKE